MSRIYNRKQLLKDGFSIFGKSKENNVQRMVTEHKSEYKELENGVKSCYTALMNN